MSLLCALNEESFPYGPAKQQRRGTNLPSALSRIKLLTKMELDQCSVRGIFQQEQGHLPGWL
jgi:hypothetical protein